MPSAAYGADRTGGPGGKLCSRGPIPILRRPHRKRGVMDRIGEVPDRYLSQEQRLMRETCRRYVDDVVRPFIEADREREWSFDVAGRLPAEILAEADRDGLRGLGVAARSGAGGVRGLPARSGRGPQPVRRIRGADSERARKRLHGRRTRDATAAPRYSPGSRALVPRPHVLRRGFARVDADHGAARRRYFGNPAKAVGDRAKRFRGLSQGLARG